MNHRLRKYFAVLKLLAGSCRSTQRRALLETADKDLIECLCECIHNVTAGNIPISRKCKVRLAKHKFKLRKILDKRTKIKGKRKLLVQSGGFLPLLLAPIVGLAGSLIGDAISGAINR